MNNDLLDDDMDWDIEKDDDDHLNFSKKETEVVMIKTFNSEDQAHLFAVTLQNEGIDAQVVGSTTAAMTPFAYGNVRLFVAASQATEASELIKKLEAEDAVHANPRGYSSRILAMIVGGLFVLGFLLKNIIAVISGFLLN